MKVTLTGNKTDGYVLTLKNDEDKFVWDVALLNEECIAIRDVLNKKIK